MKTRREKVVSLLFVSMLLLSVSFAGAQATLAPSELLEDPKVRPPPELRVEPQETVATPPATKEVDVAINGLIGDWCLSGFEIWLYYNTWDLDYNYGIEAVECKLGSFAEEWNITYPVIPCEINAEEDYVHCAYMYLGAPEDYRKPSGSGALITITFEITQGFVYSDLTLRDTQLASHPGGIFGIPEGGSVPIPHTTKDGFITTKLPIPELRVEPQETVATPPATKEVDVAINGLIGDWCLSGFEIWLYYNTWDLDYNYGIEAVECKLGSFAEEWNITYPVIPCEINAEEDYVHCAYMYLGAPEDYRKPSGSGALITITFEITQGFVYSDLTLKDTHLAMHPTGSPDPHGGSAPIPHTTKDGFITTKLPIPKLKVEPQTVLGEWSTPFEVNVVIEDLVEDWYLSGFDITLHYHMMKYASQGIEAVGVRLGSFAEEFSMTQKLITEINTTGDYVHVAYMYLGTPEDYRKPQGSGALITITFNLTWNPWSDLTLKNTHLAMHPTGSPDPHGGSAPIPHTTKDGLMTRVYKVVGLGDINGDGIVNIYDVTQAAAAYGSKPGYPNWDPDADVNGDGKVDIYDVVTICGYYGKRY